MTAPRDDATAAQVAAADPAGSVWLAANAGSGKTRVLTDRVAWLLLEGTPPERILCLTYTKAAAGEMQNRLYRRLSSWAMIPDAALRAELGELGVPVGRVSSERLRHARTLFARAIETPGGLKIQTIHAFCASLLRRFPLEAGVSPAFSEMDDTATARLHARILDAMASGNEAGLVDAVASRLSDAEPSAFLRAVASVWPAGTAPMGEAALRDALEIGADTEASVRDAACGDDMLDLIEGFLGDAEGAPGTTVSKLAARLAQARLADPDTRFDLMRAACLTDKNEQRKTGGWPKAVQAGDHGPLVELFGLMADRMADAVARIGALDALDQSRALHAFAPAFTARLAAAKAAQGWLDFDDLITRACHLLRTRETAQWVLFKLDGGLDHILVDEAQDTAPAQWRVIAALAAEFGAGQGARPDVVRTLFVVGDRKQSIYGFQGADLAAYDRMREVFGEMLQGGPADLRDHALRHSFRSSPVILGLVDRVFAGGGDGVGPPPVHLPFHPHMPGRVDLWPAMAQDRPDHGDRRWFDPVDRPAANDAQVLLARRVAQAVRRMIDAGTPIVHRGVRRAVGPGDVLILLQRRRDLFHHIVRECKALDLDLAGADRLRLRADMAVRDLIAALTWAASPGDDLSLATVLRSPLGGVDEAGLFALAHGRGPRPLWDVLRDSRHDRDAAMLADLLSVADILRPYELLQRILIRHDGRRRLLARIGPESAEAMDALLAQALTYEQLETPSLAGFLGWLASADPELKRQSGSGSIRVMSVHGAKGLESPVVILPETMLRRPRGIDGVRRMPGGPPVWMPARSGWSPALHDLARTAAEADAAERDRLLYVALTRAESWLIVAAAGDVGEAAHDSWWQQVRAGMDGAEALDDGTLRLQAGDWAPLGRPADAGAGAAATPPAWFETPAPPAHAAPPPLAPSGLPGPKALASDAGGDAGDEAGSHAGDDAGGAMARGTAIHLLLERLPGLPPSDRARAAQALLGPDAADALPEAEAVLDAPHLAHVFAPGTLAEVPFSLPRDGDLPAMAGTMDRILLSPGVVTIVDFKSNATVPDDAAAVPSGLMAQMGAYLAAARAIWPDRRIDLAILWTRTATLMPLPQDAATRAWTDAARVLAAIDAPGRGA